MINKVSFQRADVSDVPALLTMYRQSFKPLYERYHDTATNPYLETPASLRAKLVRPGSYYEWIVNGTTRVGVIRVTVTDTPPITGRISPILILPAYQGQHLAEAALKAIEGEFATVQRWTLDTIVQEPKLMHLYQKMGYHRVVGKLTTIQPGMDIVYFEKLR